jgi:hypothetical protein
MAPVIDLGSTKESKAFIPELQAVPFVDRHYAFAFHRLERCRPKLTVIARRAHLSTPEWQSSKPAKE